jgi:hypothetical protein
MQKNYEANSYEGLAFSFSLNFGGCPNSFDISKDRYKVEKNKK